MQTRNRVASIDILRGVVMIIMALDHTRDLLHQADANHVSGLTNDPLNLGTTTPILFFTRWITHFCAPVFVFLSGMSAWFQSGKKTKRELSRFLITRGLWLVLVEFIVVTFGITFNPYYPVFILQVIWAIGTSMIILGLMIHLPFRMILITGVLIVAGHNLLDLPAVNQKLQGGPAADLLYFSRFSVYQLNGGHAVFIIYSFVPWAGVMMLGYCFGKMYELFNQVIQRRQMLFASGLALLFFFLALRILNVYGDPVPWTVQKNGLFSFLSFINVNKYPPSLAYLSMTIGAALILLGILETSNNTFTRFANVFGRVPFFYYILHFYLLHLVMIIVFYGSGFSSEQVSEPGNPFFFKPPGFGVSLAGVYIIWIVIIILLYPLCRRYNRYKTENRQWWLSYL